MVASPFRAPKGTHDVLPPASARWEALLATFADLAGRAGYGLVQSPMFEDLGVFTRIGESTDVVTKEMYELRDKGDRLLALRPEGTASVARAVAQHHPPLPFKAWYATPCFRYEQPQSGRLRQHHQVGIEALGSADPDLDVEVLALAHDYLAALGLARVDLVLNSMGTREDRSRYLAELRSWLATRAGDLDPGDAERIDTAPMRILDSKRPATREVVAEAPRITDHLSDEAEAHFDRVREGLGALGISYVLEPRLVRGLDYYTHTTFEFQATSLDAAQSTVIGGGRYDGLVEALGGPPTPGIGFGSGIERILSTCDAEGTFPGPQGRVAVFVVDTTEARHAARDLCGDLRRAGIATDRAFDARSMRSQMKAADRSGARVALIVGEAEADAGTVAVRPLTGENRDQRDIDRSRAVSHVRELLR